MKAIMDLTARSFHFRQSLDICVSEIAKLDAYKKSETTRKDSPIKIRQDLLATSDVVELALYLRRFSEITNSRKTINGISVRIHELEFIGGKTNLKTENLSLYKLVSRLIHSKTCAVCRNVLDLFLHFDARGIPRNLLDGPFAAKAVLVVDTDLRPKKFCWLREFLDGAYTFLMTICEKDQGTKDYLNRRNF